MFFFFKQKTAYEMRISDWSSDVCSSDLANDCERGHVPAKKYEYNYDLNYLASHYGVSADVLVVMGETPSQQCNSYAALEKIGQLGWQIGRASCRERVCQYV